MHVNWLEKNKFLLTASILLALLGFLLWYRDFGSVYNNRPLEQPQPQHTLTEDAWRHQYERERN